MPKITELTVKYAERIPVVESMDEGVLYVSEKYGTAIHLCACGCGIQTVTPLKENGWTLSKGDNNTVSLSPSIGNFQFPCKSHYWLTDSRIVWC